MIENGAGGKKIFVQNKKEQNVIDIAEQWCDYDSYKVLKDHFDSVTPPKVQVLSPRTRVRQTLVHIVKPLPRKNEGNQKQNQSRNQVEWLNLRKRRPKSPVIWTVFKAENLSTFLMLMN